MQVNAQQWGDLVGKTSEQAQNAILAVDPTFNVMILPHDSPMTEDYKQDRVRIFVNEQNKVVFQPSRG